MQFDDDPAARLPAEATITAAMSVAKPAAISGAARAAAVPRGTAGLRRLDCHLREVAQLSRGAGMSLALDAMTEQVRTGVVVERPDLCATFDQVEGLVGLDEANALDARYAPGGI